MSDVNKMVNALQSAKFDIKIIKSFKDELEKMRNEQKATKKNIPDEFVVKYKNANRYIEISIQDKLRDAILDLLLDHYENKKQNLEKQFREL